MNIFLPFQFCKSVAVKLPFVLYSRYLKRNKFTITDSFLQQIQSKIQHYPNKIVPMHPILAKDVNELKQKHAKQAAVLILLCNHYEHASILFTLRSNNVSTHKSQVSFPGGHRESNETFIEASIRETYEELGSGIGNIRILGTCEAIPSITKTIVTPVIGYLDCDVENYRQFHINTSEVSKVFTRKCEILIQEEYKTYQSYERDGVKIKVPVFGSINEPSEEVIWGLTGFILDAFLNNVLVPCMKETKIKNN